MAIFSYNSCLVYPSLVIREQQMLNFCDRDMLKSACISSGKKSKTLEPSGETIYDRKKMVTLIRRK